MTLTGHVTRRAFVKTAVVTSVFFLSGLSFVKTAFAEKVAQVKSRTKGVYDQDTRMKYRKSQDNPMIKQIYKEFLHEPNSHEAHHLLHTEYVDRSAKVAAARKKGATTNL